MPVVSEEEKQGLVAYLFNWLFYVDPKTASSSVYGRLLIYVMFLIWGWSFILMELPSNEVGQSFMHNINLVFHEAGHVIFRIFGDFMMFLGGSLGQLLMPLIVVLAFVIKQRDCFGASIGLWWLGQSMIDLSPYINDARALKLPLLGGGTGADRPGMHDWHNILLDLDLLKYDQHIAAFVDTLGELVVILALAWGACILYLHFQTLKNSPQ